jgi:molecular chaperone DnaK
MGYGVGVDLGTSFTSAAVSGPGGTRMVSMSPEVIVPSVAYAAPDGTLLTGTAAVRAASDPARLARNFKRRLGDPTPLVLGGSPYSPAALMAAQLRDVLAAVTAWAGGPPGSIVLTCPAIWGPYRQEHFTEVLRLANVSDYRLVTEPEAAATHYSGERRLGDGEVVAVYDLGGGTFDTTILRMRNGRMEILGTPEGIEHMGGIDFDETLLAHLDDRLDGAISELDPADPGGPARLAEIRAMCVRAKEELSIEPDVRLTVPLPAGPREVTVTRLELNDMIRPSLQLTTDALRRTIGSAGLRPDDLSAVLLAGGSSRIPLVSQLVSREFGKPVRVTLHPKFTVALGAATIATRASAPNPVTSPPADPSPSRPASPVPSLAGTPLSPNGPRHRTKWLVPALALALVIAVAVTTTVLLTSNDGEAQSGSGTETPGPPPASGPPSGSEGTSPAPRQLGPGWQDRGIIQDTQFPSTNRFWMVDIDKNRRAEFVAVGPDQKFRFWWNSGPSGRNNWVPFTPGQNSYVPAPGAVRDELAFGDLDGDDFPDCMVVDLSGRVTVHTWKGDNPSGARMCMKKYDGVADVFWNGSSGDRPVIESISQILFADVTGEGRDDYLLIDPFGTTFAWYNGDFVVTPEGGSVLDWALPEQIAWPQKEKTQFRYADINGDKRADLILLTAKGGARAWINDGAVGDPAKHRDIGRLTDDAEVPPKDIQFADVDGDGRADFLWIEPTGVVHAWLNKLPADYFDTFHP